jgi:hypothetical protein
VLGVAIAGTVLFIMLATTDRNAATLFFEMIRYGPSVLSALPGEQQAIVRADIATAFRGVFLTVACFSCIIIATAWTMPVRRM